MKTDHHAPGELRMTLWTFRREFLVVGLFSFAANLLMLAPTIYMLQIFDRVLVSQSELTLLAVSLITLMLLGLMAASEWVRSRLLVGAGLRFDALVGTRVFNASFSAYLSQASASPSRAFGDLLQIRQFLTGNGIFAFFDAPWAPIYIGVMFFLHPVLGGLAVAFALVQAALAWFGHRRAVAPSEAASKAASEVTAYLWGKLRNAEVLEAMGMIANLQARWQERQQHSLALGARAQGITHRISAWSKFIRYSQQSLALAVGALLVIQGQLSVGAMIAATVLMTRALAPIDQMVSVWRAFLGARAAFARLEALLARYPERDAALPRVPPTGRISLTGVVATAPGRAEPILKGVTLSLAPGTATVVLGPSGSGKSTLARCMMGIWPDLSGQVLLDDLPIDGWNRIELGPHLGYLPQDIELFEGSIAENIARFGEIDSGKVIEATRCTGLHETILRLPKGYDTQIGEAGALLSGGQRQRIGLARALYGGPALLVLDEPDANLDDAGEEALVRTVGELRRQGRTVLLITHRPAVMAAADRLLVLRDGRVRADGPRDEVLALLRPRQPAAVAAATEPA
ncbi:MAG: type I secretion system permease/ATPase [Ramlibacter sp.]|nr:type I secretion system permease/ATPase [Ramlibacter sp.]